MFVGGFVAMAAVVPLGLASGSGGSNAARIPLGDYAGNNNPGAVAHFGSVTGTHPTLATDYLDGASGWGAMTSAGNVHAWRGSGYRLVLGVPIIPNGTGGSLSAGASGAYDSNFVTLANNLVSAGLSDAILRLGWEFNGTWYNWSVRNSTDAQNFAGYWRHIVTAMRSVSGQSFAYIWNPNGDGPTNYSPDQAYPGDAYVDYVGTDIYDNCWCSPQNSQNAWTSQLTHAWGLNWLAGFGAAHGKALGFPEWSVDYRHDGHGLGDDPYFIHQFSSWIAANNTAFTNIFAFDAPDQQNNITDGSFPNALAAFRTDFGGASTPLVSRPTAAPAPAPVPAAAPIPVAPRPAPRPAPAVVHAPVPRIAPAAPAAPTLPPISAILHAMASAPATAGRPVSGVPKGALHGHRSAQPLTVQTAGSSGLIPANFLGLGGLFLVGGLVGLAIATRTGRSRPRHAMRGRPIYVRYALLAR
jgi:hypothetical protein